MKITTDSLILEKAILERLDAHIIAECREVDREERFDVMLDECYSFESVGGPFAHMQPSRVLKENDPVAYRCAVNDYESSCEWVEVGGNYYEQEDAEKAKEEFIDELRSEESELEGQIDGCEDADEGKSLCEKRAEVQAQIEACERHSF